MQIEAVYKIINLCTRHKHKLNMLKSRSKLLSGAVILFGLELLCKLFNWSLTMWILFFCAALFVLVLLIWVAIEWHQDKVLNRIAEEEIKNGKDERT